MLALLLFAVVTVAGCAPDPVTRFEADFRESVDLACMCAQELGESTVEECRQRVADEFPTELLECARTVYDAYPEELTPRFECAANKSHAFVSCVERVLVGCPASSPEALMGCAQVLEELRACPPARADIQAMLSDCVP